MSVAVADELLTPEEVAHLLKVPKATVYKWVHQRKIPHVKVGRHLRFVKAEILEWVEEQRREMES